MSRIKEYYINDKPHQEMMFRITKLNEKKNENIKSKKRTG